MDETDGADNNARDARIGKILCDLHDRKARGEVICVEDIKAAYPDLAEELSRYLAVLGSMRSSDDYIAELVARGVLAKSNAVDGRTSLGAYQTLEPIGRGGMGIVLKAYEERLNRLVRREALKTADAQTPRTSERRRVTRKCCWCQWIRLKRTAPRGPRSPPFLLGSTASFLLSQLALYSVAWLNAE